MKTLKRITKERLLSWGPCLGYNTLEDLEQYWGPKTYLTPLQIAGLDSVPIIDRLWVLLRTEIIEGKRLYLLAYDFTEDSIRRIKRTIDVQRAWVRGETSEEESGAACVVWAASAVASAAACAAARAAARAARSAASAAASDATRAAPWDAVRSSVSIAAARAARAAVEQKQLNMVIAVLKEQK